jgi:hypothetical protein
MTHIVLLIPKITHKKSNIGIFVSLMVEVKEIIPTPLSSLKYNNHIDYYL